MSRSIGARAYGPGLVAAGLFLLAPLLFAANMVGARWMNGSLPPLTLAFSRWLVAALLLTPLVLRALPQVGAGEWKALAWMALLGGALSVGPQYAAATYTSASHIALVFATTPLLVALIERLFWKVPLGLGQLAGIAVAFTGIAVATSEGHPGQLLQLAFNRGDLLALCAAMAWAGYTARVRHVPVALPPLAILWAVAAGGALMLLPAAGLEWALEGSPVLSAGMVEGVLFLALVAGIGAYLVYGQVVARLGAARASMSMYLVPIFALALGMLLLGEELQPYHLVATLLVLGGVCLASLLRR